MWGLCHYRATIVVVAVKFNDNLEGRESMFSRIYTVSVLMVLSLFNPAFSATAETTDNQMTNDYYHNLAMTGESYAQLALGEAHLNGNGVRKNYILAYAWLYAASQQGLEEANVLLPDALAQMNPHEQAQAIALGKEFIKAYNEDSMSPP